ncbi:multiubiquitin domain-containing protein [Phycicoccus sp.]|uniref:multiubiquitin domain-containing protein n=1 Tax=Phycicoccus sp. TaxID=1902410 RepID=UPI002CAEF015|nr:multiubiquitin domain-containing protein [Phycicoccus sp.]HMM95060.1 multiubiquitin domain-containing protein [Phycicoccus sp.]
MTATASTVKGKPNTVINIHINDEHYKVTRGAMTGAELAQLAGVPVGNQLFLEVPGAGDDRPIAPAETVELKSGMRFYDVPVGNLG